MKKGISRFQKLQAFTRALKRYQDEKKQSENRYQESLEQEYDQLQENIDNWERKLGLPVIKNSEENSELRLSRESHVRLLYDAYQELATREYHNEQRLKRLALISKIKKYAVGIALAIFIIGTIGIGMGVYGMIENREIPEFPSFYFQIISTISTYGIVTLMLAGMAIAAFITGVLVMFVMKLLRI